jgi:hypothetical protein
MSRPFIPVANVASVELIYSQNAQVVENVFNVQKGSPYTLSDLQAVRTIFNSWDNATWAGARGTGCSLVRIRTKARDTNSSPMEDFPVSPARAGTVGGAMMPGNCTFSLKLATGHQGRSYRGRIYLVGVTTALLNSGNYNLFDPTSASNIIAKLATLITNLATGGHTLGVVSLMADKTWRTAGVFTQATGFTAVDYNVDSMRRRLTGRGL